MTEKRKAPETGVTAVDRWNRAVREAYVDDGPPADARAVLEASDEEIERQLLAAGVDLAAEDAKAAATYEAAVAKFGAGARASDEADPRSEVAWVASTARPSVTQLGARRSRSVWIAWAVAAAAATGGAAYIAGHQPHEEERPRDVPTVTPTDPTPIQPPPPAVPTPAASPSPLREDKAPQREDKAPR